MPEKRPCAWTRPSTGVQVWAAMQVDLAYAWSHLHVSNATPSRWQWRQLPWNSHMSAQNLIFFFAFSDGKEQKPFRMEMAALSFSQKHQNRVWFIQTIDLVHRSSSSCASNVLFDWVGLLHCECPPCTKLVSYLHKSLTFIDWLSINTIQDKFFAFSASKK